MNHQMLCALDRWITQEPDEPDPELLSQEEMQTEFEEYIQPLNPLSVYVAFESYKRALDAEGRISAEDYDEFNPYQGT